MILSTQYTTPYVYRLLSSVHNRPSPEIKNNKFSSSFLLPTGVDSIFQQNFKVARREKKVKKMNWEIKYLFSSGSFKKKLFSFFLF
jgi:hypothetical protein